MGLGKLVHIANNTEAGMQIQVHLIPTCTLFFLSNPLALVQDVGMCIAKLAVNNSSYSIIQACFQLWQVVKPTVSVQGRNLPSKGKFPKLPAPGCLVTVLHGEL